MGEPAARPVIQEWIDRLFESIPSKQEFDAPKMLLNGEQPLTPTKTP